ncbi:XrtA system polysaccharide chain length determinant [Sphingomonas mucosissima]|uniref:Chromosome partition protein Smc n=1 Tax=Sphingomonas mucosissima TaxID=370959 RepID=A0A245ZR25_9SPHN|nr:XrtA system polysaccharide chain length determinant [Sphingomonas mucosissima]OWK32187.1 chromosome partition protein Smc [Sphingomonas mucosissima]
MTGLYEEIRIAVHAVWTRRWMALAVAWAICLLGWLVVSQMPSRYESRARVFVQMRSVLPTTGDAGAMGDQQRDIDTVRQTLTSAVNLEKVVRGTDLAKTASNDREVADRAAGLQNAIKITAQQDNLFEIVSVAATPKLASSITQKLIDIFVETNLSDDRTQSAQTLQFLDGQLQSLGAKLQDAEAKRAEFQNNYLGSLPGTGSVSDRIGAARSQMSQVDAELASASSSLAALQGQLSATPPSIAGLGGTAAVGPVRARLAAIQGQLADARGRGYTDNHPDVIALKSQLAQAQSAARSEPTGAAAGGTPNPAYLSLQSMLADRQANVAALRMRKQQLQADLETISAKLAGDPQAAAQQGEIERNYTVLKDQYDRLLAQREQVNLRSQAQSQTDAVKFSVIDPPTQPRTPTAPNRPLLLTGVLIVGILGGIGSAFAMSKVQATFPTAQRLEKASGMPVIGSIGEMLTRQQSELRQKRLRLFIGGAGALAVGYVALLGVEMLQRGLAA